MAEPARIIFATDFSEGARTALPWARQLCEKFDAELHCVTAVQELLVYTPMMTGAPVSFPSVEDLGRQAQTQLDDFIRDELRDLGNSVTASVLHGRPADEIVRYADEIGATMIVMATRGRGGVAHVVMGSTAEGVLRQAKCPVLTVRAS